MRAICVEDEPILLEWLLDAVKSSPDIDSAVGFGTVEETLDYAKNNEFDIAFLDVELGEINGIELAKSLREISSKCGIIFCTGHANYAVDAINNISVNGYLLKPIEAQEVNREIERFKKSLKKVITVDLTHGIEIYSPEGEAIVFKRTKTEELFSILVKANGESVSVKTICDSLWGESHDSYLYEKNRQYLTQLFLDLRKTLEQFGLEGVVKKTDVGYAVMMSSVYCKK